jgi:hypothetical protein
MPLAAWCRATDSQGNTVKTQYSPVNLFAVTDARGITRLFLRSQRQSAQPDRRFHSQYANDLDLRQYGPRSDANRSTSAAGELQHDLNGNLVSSTDRKTRSPA